MTDSATDSKATSKSEVKAMRIDPPHDLMLANREDEPAPPWMAIAGLDPTASNDQLDRQTSELLAYVQQQNDEIDLRQAELNAKLAQLDNELRAARLRATRDAGVELVSGAMPDSGMPSDPSVGSAISESAVASAPPQEYGIDLNGMSETDAGPVELVAKENAVDSKASDMVEFDEVSHIVAQFADSEKSVPAPETTVQVSEPQSSEVSEPERVGPEESEPEESELEASTGKPSDEPKRFFRIDGAHKLGEHRRDLDKVPLQEVPIEELQSRSIGRSELDLELEAMATSLDAAELESERRHLAERKIELDKRKVVLQRMQSETQSLHREALEMRLVTEQLWIEISETAAPEHVNELLSNLRARLDQHYVEQQQEIKEQAGELVDLKESIEQKQEDLRLQSNQLQQWVETRHDEIKSYAAEVDARELLLDRREHRMREEFSKWEAARAAYQQQLQGLLSKFDK